MPFGDRTGPLGQGSRTGRAAGYCVGNNNPGSMTFNSYRGRGIGGGRGGFGFRNQFYATGMTRWQLENAPDEIMMSQPVLKTHDLAKLKNQITSLKKELENLTQKIKELEETGQE